LKRPRDKKPRVREQKNEVLKGGGRRKAKQRLVYQINEETGISSIVLKGEVNEGKGV